MTGRGQRSEAHRFALPMICRGVGGAMANEDMTCPNCGARVRAGMKFCTGCGDPVTAGQSAAEPPRAVAPATVAGQWLNVDDAAPSRPAVAPRAADPATVEADPWGDWSP
ncbi:MAG: zinc-ribbon domain-containing protein, partial [Acidimicrobiales bacterium]